MSDGGSDGAPAAEPGDRGERPAAPGRDGRDGREEHGEQTDQAHLFQTAPGGAEGAAGAGVSRAAREAAANFTVHGTNTVIDSARGAVHVGNVYQYQAARSALVSGVVPREELRRLRLVFAEPEGYPQLRDRLRERRLVALCGDGGTGRAYAALSLLDELTRGTVQRMDPRTEIDRIADEDIEQGNGYLLEIAVDDLRAREYEHGGPGHFGGPGGPDGPGGYAPARPPERAAHRPAELHLDRLRDLLTARDAYAVLVVDAGDFADELLRGRYGSLFQPPDADRVFRRHLRSLLGSAEPEAAERAAAVAGREEVIDALGLERLRPHEAVDLADLVARQARGELCDADLLAGCAEFAHRQARSWFAGAGRGDTLATALATLRPAAFRGALAVFNGAPYSLAAEAAEQLAWEFATTWAPTRVPGRPLFTDNEQARLTAVRAVLEDGEVPLGEATVPVRTVRYQGRALSLAVLAHMWDHHNARGPMCRWLRTLSDDGRPAVWVRAATACAVLIRMDFPYAVDELLLPLARAESATQRMAAATAAASAAAEPVVNAGLRELVRDWERSDEPLLRRTAALAHGFGSVEATVSATLGRLGRMAPAEREPDAEGWTLLHDIALSVIRLLGGAEPDTVISRIGGWFGDRRMSRQTLGLLCVAKLVSLRAWTAWGLTERPALERYHSWPMLAALLATAPEQRPRLADLVRHALDVPRARQAVLGGLAEWVRRAGRDERLLAELAGFLPLLAAEPAGRDRLLHLLRTLERDPDETVSSAVLGRARQALTHTEGSDAR